MTRRKPNSRQLRALCGTYRDDAGGIPNYVTAHSDIKEPFCDAPALDEGSGAVRTDEVRDGGLTTGSCRECRHEVVAGVKMGHVKIPDVPSEIGGETAGNKHLPVVSSPIRDIPKRMHLDR
jgi:hypothetical protein